MNSAGKQSLLDNVLPNNGMKKKEPFERAYPYWGHVGKYVQNWVIWKS